MLPAENGTTVGPGARYLGYGLMEAFGSRAGQLARPCLLAPLQFSIDLLSHRPLDASLLAALKLMGLLGGLGGRSRRGYGSLSILSLAGDVEQWEPPTTKDEYADRLRAVVRPGELPRWEPPYSAFSSLSRVVICEVGKKPLELLDHVGRQMQRYRSWGHHGKVNGEPSEQNFQEDHDWFKNRTNFEVSHPKRVIFGLPHNYSKAVGIVSQGHERRASPLAIHIHTIGVDKYLSVMSILCSNFLPKGDKFLVRDGSVQRSRDPQIDWTVLDRFIDGVNKNTRQPYFPNRTQILP